MRKGPFSFEGSVPSYTQPSWAYFSYPFEEGIHVSLLRLGYRLPPSRVLLRVFLVVAPLTVRGTNKRYEKYATYLQSVPSYAQLSWAYKRPVRETREGKSYPVRLFPHGSLKKTLKRKGKHTKTNSYLFSLRSLLFVSLKKPRRFYP